MAEFIDLFSGHAENYARARPKYPAELFAYVAALCSNRKLAWDVGTGNGQAASGLVEHFERVIATDASEGQLAHAAQHERIEYRVALAEDADLPAASVDLVTIAQALHWIRFDDFYANVRRVGRPQAIIAAWCYTLPRVSAAVDAVCDRFCYDRVGHYWEAGRQYVEDRYENIPFPFDEIKPTPTFACRSEWSLAQYLDYVRSWSAVQRFIKTQGFDPMTEIAEEMAAAWGEATRVRVVTSPIYLRVGRVAAKP
jgi:ubiquinone/menaquinone biosynthesis C-methylase UbiE